MTPYYQEPNQTLYCGHVLEVLKELPAESIDMVMTSPPYWGLRTYKTEPQIWGIWGDNHCEHAWGRELVKAQAHGAGETNPGKEGYTKDKDAWSDNQGNFCLRCNAWRGELGLEPHMDCGRPFMKLRNDLTQKERDYVMQRLQSEGLI